MNLARKVVDGVDLVMADVATIDDHPLTVTKVRADQVDEDPDEVQPAEEMDRRHPTRNEWWITLWNSTWIMMAN